MLVQEFGHYHVVRLSVPVTTAPMRRSLCRRFFGKPWLMTILAQQAYTRLEGRYEDSTSSASSSICRHHTRTWRRGAALSSVRTGNKN